MRTIPDTLEILKQYARFRSQDDIEKFDHLVADLAATKDPKYITVFLETFKDKTDFFEVMFSLIHAIESYPIEVYIPLLTRHAEKTAHKSPHWLVELLNRILNDNRARKCFEENMYLASKNDMIRILELVSQEIPHHKQLCAQLIKKLVENDAAY